MDFTKIAKNDIEIALQKLRLGEVPHGYLPSTDYDVYVDGEKFPPKQVIALACENATGELPRPNIFRGGKKTLGFKILENLGYEIAHKTFPEECLAIFAYFAVATRRIDETQIRKELAQVTKRPEEWWKFKLFNVQEFFRRQNFAGKKIHGLTLISEIKKAHWGGRTVQDRLSGLPIKYFLNNIFECELLARGYLRSNLSPELELALFKLSEPSKYIVHPESGALSQTWIFQGNPRFFRIDDYLNSREEFYWTIKQFKKIIKIGDIVYIWRSGKNAGIVAVAQVTSHVEIVSDDSTDYWIQKSETNSAETERVKLRILERRVDNPLLKDDVKVRLPDWSFIKSPQGTNFKVSIEQSEIINNLLGFKNESISTVETDEEDYVQDAESQQKDKEIQDSVEKVKSDQELLDLINKIESKLISAPLREKRKTAYAISRNPTISKLIKQRAGYKCELCGEFGFEKKNGGLYAEAHHLHELGQGGLDLPSNLVCLCAGCHRRIHWGKDSQQLIIRLSRKD
jgi:5-methylcytosine-specific restriction endonuclease McrA